MITLLLSLAASALMIYIFVGVLYWLFRFMLDIMILKWACCLVLFVLLTCFIIF